MILEFRFSAIGSARQAYGVLQFRIPVQIQPDQPRLADFVTQYLRILKGAALKFRCVLFVLPLCYLFEDGMEKQDC